MRCLLALVFFHIAACDSEEDQKTCTQIGWNEGFTLEIFPDPEAPLPEGVYVFDVVADAVDTRLGIRFDANLVVCAGNEGGCRSDLAAGDDRTLYTGVEAYYTSEEEVTRLLGFELRLMYVARDGDRQVGAAGPAVVDVVVGHDDVVLGEAHFEPEYVVFEPNGPGCGVATAAEDTMSLAVPPPP